MATKYIFPYMLLLHTLLLSGMQDIVGQAQMRHTYAVNASTLHYTQIRNKNKEI